VGPDSTSDPIQYTSRENDGTGLYFYRARYYDPVLKRFIGSDPIGLAGGMNTYGYVGGNPISRSDPEGLDWYRPQNYSQPYFVGREGHPLVPPGGLISKFIEECVPAGRTFGEIHDARVNQLVSRDHVQNAA
jgi:RHS repeat-associated protein